jgi:protein dispatched 1
LAIFIILGIAADDIFVFVDGWKQSLSNPIIAHDRRRRLPYAFRRAVRATATTSSTTAAAFLANLSSPLLPMRSFGLYCAVLIIVNYALLIIFLPPLIIW